LLETAAVVPIFLQFQLLMVPVDLALVAQFSVVVLMALVPALVLPVELVERIRALVDLVHLEQPESARVLVVDLVGA
jgi:diacylglycerol kinase